MIDNSYRLDKMKLEQPETRNHMQLPLLGKVLQLLAVKLKGIVMKLLENNNIIVLTITQTQLPFF